MESNYPDIKESIGIVLIMLFFMVFFYPIESMLASYLDKELLLFLAYTLSVGIPFLIFHKNRRKKTGQTSYNLNTKDFQILPVVIAANSALLFGVSTPIISLIPFPDFMKEILIELSKLNGFYSALTIVFIGPVLEELIFRGIVLDGLLKKYSPMKAVIVSSLLFGFIHLNPWQFLGAAIFGLLSGWVYFKTRNILLTVAMHITNNGISFIQSFFYSEREMIESSFSEFYGGTFNAVLVVGGCILILFASLLYMNTYFKQKTITLVHSSTEI